VYDLIQELQESQGKSVADVVVIREAEIQVDQNSVQASPCVLELESDHWRASSRAHCDGEAQVWKTSVAEL
jgi:predicted negative regulator of RcsB-dependent stress response